MAAVPGEMDAFVIGGRAIYEQALSDVTRMYWTQVHAAVEGDVKFPLVDWTQWQLVYDEPCPADIENDYPFSFRMYDRRASR